MKVFQGFHRKITLELSLVWTEVSFIVSHFAFCSGDRLTISRNQTSVDDHLCSNSSGNGKDEVLDLENDDH